jgi:hypothetical protein
VLALGRDVHVLDQRHGVDVAVHADGVAEGHRERRVVLASADVGEQRVQLGPVDLVRRLAQQLVEPPLGGLGSGYGLVAVGEPDAPQPEDVGVGHGDDPTAAVGLAEAPPDVADELVEMGPVAHQVRERRVNVTHGGHVRTAEAPERFAHRVGLGPERLDERQAVGRVAAELAGIG